MCSLKSSVLQAPKNKPANSTVNKLHLNACSVHRVVRYAYTIPQETHISIAEVLSSKQGRYYCTSYKRPRRCILSIDLNYFQQVLYFLKTVRGLNHSSTHMRTSRIVGRHCWFCCSYKLFLSFKASKVDSIELNPSIDHRVKKMNCICALQTCADSFLVVAVFAISVNAHYFLVLLFSEMALNHVFALIMYYSRDRCRSLICR